jgi:hypothetical protein
METLKGNNFEDLGVAVGIKMDLKEIGLWGVDKILLAQGRDRWWVLVNTVSLMSLRVPQQTVNI